MQYQLKHILAFGLSVALVGLTVVSCTSRDKPMKTVSESQAGETVSESQAVELARKELLKQGLKVDDYRVTVRTSTIGTHWLVFFDPKVRRKPGEGYWLTVDKASGKTVRKHQD